MKIKFLFLIPLLLCGCATTDLNPLQLRQIESKDIEASYDDVFRATMSVLQDAGYIIKNSDYKTGVILAETGKKYNFMSGNSVWEEVTATVEQFTKETVKERIVILSKTLISQVYGGGEQSSREDNPQILQKLYADINQEVFRRQNLAK